MTLRALSQHWKLAAIATLSLAVAMAIGVLGLSVLNTILILAPAAPEAERLMTVSARSPGNPQEQISYPDYQYFRQHNHVFTDLAAAPNSIGVNFQDDFEGREVKVLTRPVSANYFAVMGLQPVLGTFFAPGDDAAKKPVAVMTYSCWKRLGADPQIVGKVLTGRTILGVLPKDFGGAFYGANGDLFLALAEADGSSEWREKREVRTLYLTGRLKPGVSQGEAQAELAALSGQLATAFPEVDKDRVAVVSQTTLLPPEAISTARIGGAILLTLVLLIVLIACANVANLLMAVAVGRRQEAAIKLALGASRERLIGEFLMESTLLCAIGAAIGFGVIAILMDRFSHLTLALPMVGVFTFSFHLKLDGTVVGMAVLLLAVASLASGLPPALYASSANLSQVLSGELVVGGMRKRARRNGLVAVQIGVGTLVLAGMGLCQSSLYKLRHVELGFSARNLAAVTMFLAAEGYEEAKGKIFEETIRRTAAAVPGVESATLASGVPLLGANELPVVVPESGGKTVEAAYMAVDGEYFVTLGMPILSGRAFHSGDGEKAQLAVIVNQKLAGTLWPGRDPLGRMLETGKRKFTVVGVVPDGRELALSDDPKPMMYWALRQNYQPGVSVIVRTKGDPKEWVAPLAGALRGLGLKIMVNPVTFEQWMNLSLFGERFAAGCVSAFGALGLMLAVVGLFASISYSVRERRRELGMRVALGASQAQLMGMVLRETTVVAGAGVGVGVVLGGAAGFLLRSQLYGIGAMEWVVLGPVGVGMLGLCLAVAWVSAWPWVRVDPMEAVRHA